MHESDRRTKALKALEKTALLFRQQIRRTIADLEGTREEDVILDFLSRQDLLRLLNIKVWSLRHKIAVPYILRFLFDYYKNIRIKRGGRKTSLGIRAATLTGTKSEQMFEQWIQREFPGQELEQAFVADQKVEISDDDKEPLVKTTSSYLSAYSRRIEPPSDITYRRRYRRAWRGNPWH